MKKRGRKGTFKITEQTSFSEIKKRYDEEKKGRIKQRLLIILKAFKIKSSYEIGDQVGVSHTKVQRWIKRFNKNGFDGLHDKPKSGKPSKLNEKQVLELKKEIDKPKEFRAGYKSLEILKLIYKLFKIKYTLVNVRRILHKRGYNRITPRSTHIDKDPIKGKIIVDKLKKNYDVWTKVG